MTANSPDTTPERAPGEIITFYSYKGGTGRSMALANVACLLAAQSSSADRGVLMVDWDLEAPGLHRYFQGKLRSRKSGKSVPSEEKLLEEYPGLIDLFLDLERETPPGGYQNEDEAAEQAAGLVERYWLRGNREKSDLPLAVGDLPKLHLLKAGRFDDEYSRRVNTFGWEGLHRRSPWLIGALAARWAEDYDYVLVDSRTGITDTSGICTVLLPEKLVVVFTPNRQSLTGVENLVRKAVQYRKASDDLRPLIVFPLPSRIEASLGDLRRLWRSGDRGRGIVGFQPLFERLFREAYSLTPEQCDLSGYFEEVQIQQTPDYAYGEEIAVLAEQLTDRFSLTRTYQTFTERLVKSEGPWTRPPEEKKSEQTTTPPPDAKSVLLAKADDFYAALSPEEQRRALRLLARLVTAAPVGQESKDKPGLAQSGRIESAALPAAEGLISAGLVVATRDAYGAGQTFKLADEALVHDWQPLREWVDENRASLLLRQRLEKALSDWEQGVRFADLLRGDKLEEAVRYSEERPEDLNEAEKSYIKRSERSAKLRRAYGVALVLAAAGIIGLLIWFFNRPSPTPAPAPTLTPAPTTTPTPNDSAAPTNSNTSPSNTNGRPGSNRNGAGRGEGGANRSG
jgi:cellulose biosynthesis protein BcsQ